MTTTNKETAKAMCHWKTTSLAAVALVVAASLFLTIPAARAGDDETVAAWIAREARDLEVQAGKVSRLIKSRQWTPAEEAIGQLRERLQLLHRRLAEFDRSTLRAEQRELLDGLAERARLMAMFADRKSELLGEDPAAHYRVVRAKAENLSYRARQLAKAARGATFPMPAERQVSES